MLYKHVTQACPNRGIGNLVLAVIGYFDTAPTLCLDIDPVLKPAVVMSHIPALPIMMSSSGCKSPLRKKGDYTAGLQP